MGFNLPYKTLYHMIANIFNAIILDTTKLRNAKRVLKKAISLKCFWRTSSKCLDILLNGKITYLRLTFSFLSL